MSVLRNLIELLVNPFCLSLLLLALCIVFLWRRAGLVGIRNTLLLVLVVLLVISTAWLPRLLTRHLENAYPVITKVDPRIHYVVVLSGGQAVVKGMPANSLLYSASIKRLIEGLRLFRQLPETKLVLSGGGYGEQVAEARLLAELAGWFALPKESLVLEQASINTADQAREIRAIVGNAPFYLVTSAVHMPRAMVLFERENLHPIAAPTDFTFFWEDERWGKLWVPNTYNLFYFSIALHEVLGRAWIGSY